MEMEREQKGERGIESREGEWRDGKMQHMARDRERETGRRRRIKRQGRGRRGRRGRRREGGRRGCEMCAGGREVGRGVPGDEGGGDAVCRGRAVTVLRMGGICCVRLAEVGAGECAHGRERGDRGGEA
ncbi:hypothetical protein AAC387_Pa09g0534 [Persea americana]